MRQRLAQEQDTDERGSYEASQSMNLGHAYISGRQETLFDANRIQSESSQARQTRLINDADTEDTEQQEAKRPIAKGKQVKLWTKYEREERIDEEEPNENQQIYSQEESRSLQGLNMTPQRGLFNTLVSYNTLKEEQSTALARLDDTTPVQGRPEISLRLEQTQEGIKRAREEVEDSEEETRARQSERGQKPVTKGRFQRLNNYSTS